MSSQNQIKLTKQGIKQCFKTEIAETKNHVVEVDFTFQIINIKPQEQNKGKIVLNCTLSDSKNKYNCFIFVKDNNNLKNFDIVCLKVISHQIMSDKTNHAFIVKKYELVDTNQTKIFGNPELYNSKNFLEDQANEKEDIQLNPYTPLKSLNIYSSNFTLKVKVTKRLALKTYENSKGKGKFFSFNVIDEEGEEMEVAAFNENADRLVNDLKEDEVYEMRDLKVKLADKKYKTFKSDYRLIFDGPATFDKIEDTGSFKNVHFNFKTLESLKEQPNYTVVDVIGFVSEISDITTVTTRNKVDMNIRRLKLVDSENYQVDISLWRSLAIDTNIVKNSILAIKSIKVVEYNGKNLNSIDDTKILINPDIPEAKKVKEFMENGYNGQPKSLLIEEKKEENTLTDIKSIIDYLLKSTDDELPFFKVKANVIDFKNSDKNYYNGCPECKSKLTEINNEFNCSSCNKNIESPNLIYSISIHIKDFSGEYWIDVFGNVAEKILKMTANEYKSLLDEKNSEKIEILKNEIKNQEFFFDLKGKIVKLNGDTRKRLVAVKIETVDNSKSEEGLGKE